MDCQRKEEEESRLIKKKKNSESQVKEYKAVRGEGGVVIRSGRARGKGKEDNRVTVPEKEEGRLGKQNFDER